jgi:hypothetical protein
VCATDEPVEENTVDRPFSYIFCVEVIIISVSHLFQWFEKCSCEGSTLDEIRLFASFPDIIPLFFHCFSWKQGISRPLRSCDSFEFLYLYEALGRFGCGMVWRLA